MFIVHLLPFTVSAIRTDTSDAEGVVVVSGTTDMYPRYIYVYTSVAGTTKVIYN